MKPAPRILELLNIEDNPSRRVEKYKIIRNGCIQTAHFRDEQLGKHRIIEWTVTHIRETRNANGEANELNEARATYRSLIIDRYFPLILQLPVVRDVQKVIWDYYMTLPMGKGAVGWKVIQYTEVKPNWTMRSRVNDWIIQHEPERWVSADVYYLMYVEDTGQKVCDRRDFDRLMRSFSYKLETNDGRTYWRR